MVTLFYESNNTMGYLLPPYDTYINCFNTNYLIIIDDYVLASMGILNTNYYTHIVIRYHFFTSFYSMAMLIN